MHFEDDVLIELRNYLNDNLCGYCCSFNPKNSTVHSYTIYDINSNILKEMNTVETSKDSKTVTTKDHESSSEIIEMYSYDELVYKETKTSESSTFDEYRRGWIEKSKHIKGSTETHITYFSPYYRQNTQPNIRSKRVYENSTLISEETYHDNGHIDSSEYYNKSGKKHGTWKNFFHSGELAKVQHYDNGKLIGTEETYRMSRFGYYLASTRIFDNDTYFSKEFHANGSLERQYTYNITKGYITGLYQEFCELTEPNRSRLKFECIFVEGARYGEFKEYASTGKLRRHAFYLEPNTKITLVSKVLLDVGISGKKLHNLSDDDKVIVSLYINDAPLLSEYKS